MRDIVGAMPKTTKREPIMIYPEAEQRAVIATIKHLTNKSMSRILSEAVDDMLHRDPELKRKVTEYLATNPEGPPKKVA